MSLLGYQFRTFAPSLALGLLKDGGVQVGGKEVSYNMITGVFANFRYDLKRLEQYTRNMADYHLITDLLPASEQAFNHVTRTHTHTHTHTVSHYGSHT